MDASNLSQHISRRYNEDLEQLRGQVLKMGGLVEQQLTQAVSALIEGDAALGQAVAAQRFSS